MNTSLPNMTSTTQHIGAAGELLVQYRLLKFGIDSARLTTDSGIDLVAYAPESSTAVTIQVKTALADGAAGGKGKPAVGWSFPHDCKAQLLAFVKLSTDSVWLMTLAQAQELAQQHSPGDMRRIYWYTTEDAPSAAANERDFEQYRLEQVDLQQLLGGI